MTAACSDPGFVCGRSRFGHHHRPRLARHAIPRSGEPARGRLRLPWSRARCLARGVRNEPFTIPPYSRDWGETGPREVLAEGARRMTPEIAPSEAGPGALILFRMTPRAIAKHVGILTGPDSFIHSYEHLGVVEEPLTPVWRRRIAFVFLFPPSGRI